VSFFVGARTSTGTGNVGQPASVVSRRPAPRTSAVATTRASVTGDRLRAEVRGPGELLLVRDEDPVEQFAGSLTGVYPAGDLAELRREWD
jgi:hypothetical protein